MAKRVVVTGLGTLSSLNDKSTEIENLVEEFWQKIVNGESGIRHISELNRSDEFIQEVKNNLHDYKTNIFGLLNFDISDYMNQTRVFDLKEDIKKPSFFIKCSLITAYAALKDAKLDDFKDKYEKAGVIIGSGIGGIPEIEEEIKKPRISALAIPHVIINAASAAISKKYNFHGPNCGIVTACASSSHAIHYAAKEILSGDADFIVTGGAEGSLAKISLGGFSSMKALSKRNNDPKTASRPFDKDRDGFVMAEGAGILVLEELEHAKKRGVNIYAELLSSYTNSDAYHLAAPDPEGIYVKSAMEKALKKAGLKPEQIGYINAHGTSTPLNDKTESKAIIDVFGEYSFDGLLVSSTKSMTGHMLGAAGAIEAIASIYALNKGIVPPTINYRTPDPELADQKGRHIDYVPNKARKKDLEAVMSNAFGFGGHNAVLIFGKYKG